MTAIDKVFSGSIPQIYETLMVPLIFAPYAQDLAVRIKTLAPRHVLETAALPPPDASMSSNLAPETDALRLGRLPDRP